MSETILEPVVMMLMHPFWIVRLPPSAVVPVMIFVPVTVCQPIRMMRLDPLRLVVAPPVGIVPLVMLVIVADSMMFIRVNARKY